MSGPETVWLSMVRFANRRTRKNRALRRVGVKTYSSLARLNRFLPPPRVLLNGPPKSGTHLLSDCLALMPKMAFSGRHFALYDFFAEPDWLENGNGGSRKPHPKLEEARLRQFLERCPQGMFVTAHARFHPVLDSYVRDLGFMHVLLLRDPRDVVVSHVFYVQREPLHHHHRHYTEALGSDEERIMATIRGFGPDAFGNTPLLSIRENFAGFLRWVQDDSTLVVRFEDLIGPRGGGEPWRQLASIKELGSFVGRPLTHAQAEGIAHAMYGKGSLTFRKGQTGDWRNHFTDDHRQAFKEVAGDLLVELGYEGDDGW